jgi:hypothetical protein
MDRERSEFLSGVITGELESDREYSLEELLTLDQVRQLLLDRYQAVDPTARPVIGLASRAAQDRNSDLVAALATYLALVDCNYPEPTARAVVKFGHTDEGNVTLGIGDSNVSIPWAVAVMCSTEILEQARSASVHLGVDRADFMAVHGAAIDSVFQVDEGGTA